MLQPSESARTLGGCPCEVMSELSPGGNERSSEDKKGVPGKEQNKQGTLESSYQCGWGTTNSSVLLKV